MQFFIIGIILLALFVNPSFSKYWIVHILMFKSYKLLSFLHNYHFVFLGMPFWPNKHFQNGTEKTKMELFTFWKLRTLIQMNTNLEKLWFLSKLQNPWDQNSKQKYYLFYDSTLQKSEIYAWWNCLVKCFKISHIFGIRNPK